MKPTVVFILSTGHAGSTLLDILCGSVPGVFSMGEVRHLPWQTFRDGKMSPTGQDLCTCGKTFKECDVWGEVLTQLSESDGIDYKKEPLRLNLCMTESWDYYRKNTLWQRAHRELIYRAIAAGKAFSFTADILIRLFAERTKQNWKMFDAVSEASGNSVLVDSTKDIVRCFAMARMRPDSVRIVVLFRDARGIAASAVKWGKTTAEKTLRAWLREYNRKIMPAVEGMGVPYEVVSYDEMTANPASVRRRIASLVDVSPENCPEVFYPREYHLVAGNPMRFKPEIRIRHDDSWKERLTPELCELSDAYQKKMILASSAE